jgi:uncharacterized membrane protein
MVHEESGGDWAKSWLGSSLLLLSALLSGAVILLFSWLYQVSAPAHVVVLLWMLSVAPLTYVARRTALSLLFPTLLLAWAALFTFREVGFFAVMDRIFFLPAVLAAGGVLLFAFGGLHYTLPGLSSLARNFRLIGLKATLLAVLLVTTPALSRRSAEATSWTTLGSSAAVVWSFALLVAAAALLTLFNMRLAPKVERLTRAEGPISLALLAVILLYALIPLPAWVYSGLFSGVLFLVILAALLTGWARRDARLADIAGLGLLGLVLIRYYDWFWAPLGWASFSAGALVLTALLVTVLLLKRKDAH